MKTNFRMLAKYLTYRNLYLLGFSSLFFSLSVSLFVISLSQIFLGLIWLTERNYKSKLNRVSRNKFFWLIVSIFLFHLLGLLYTTEFNYAFNDLRIKLPILLIPFFFASIAPLKKAETRTIFFFFIAGLIVSTSFSYCDFLSASGAQGFDVRNASHFISHIRLSLMMALAIIFLIFELVKNKVNPFFRVLLGLTSISFLIYMLQLQMLSGVFALGIAGFVVVEVKLFKLKNTLYKKSAFILSLILVITIGAYVFSAVESFVFPNTNSALCKVSKKTANGNDFIFNAKNKQLENGNLVWDQVCEYELEKEWNKMSEISYYNNGNTGQAVRFSLIRYLTSKKLPKDSDGIRQLSSQEVNDIENGATNFKFIQNKGLSKRIYETAWELHNYIVNKGNPSGNSVAQRIEFWRAAKYVIKHNLLFGVGTGDIVVELNKAYVEINTVLSPEYRYKPHNQYITIFVTFGFIGLVWFLAVLLICFIHLKNNYLGFAFLIIVSLSMLMEDTIETQVGVTFFAGFISLFAIGMVKQTDQN